jgi:hypothetical protein
VVTAFLLSLAKAVALVAALMLGVYGLAKGWDCLCAHRPERHDDQDERNGWFGPYGPLL